MPVVVNEMDVVPATEAARATSGASTPEGKPMDGVEVERAATKRIERQIRLRAH